MAMLEPGADGQQRLALIASADGKSWTATEWRWSPSPRAATRSWQAARWKLLNDAVLALRQAAPPAMPAEPFAQVRLAWENSLKGRPGEIGKDRLFWKSHGQCMQMLAMPATSDQIPLPQAREDARLELRAAMRVQLARSYPDASWIMPFSLLDSGEGPPRVHARYISVWVDKGVVAGQLWIPSTIDTLRLRVLATPGVKTDSVAGKAAAAAIGSAIEAELRAIESAWSALYER
jgi:hypothetical protein